MWLCSELKKSLSCREMVTLPALAMMWLCSELKKSLSAMLDTQVRAAFSFHGLMAGDLLVIFLQFSLTGGAARRSELPSRSTGLTADPRTFAYTALMASSSAFLGLAG